MSVELVLMHGWGFDASIWDAVCENPQLRGARTHRIDLGFRGGPQSPILPTDQQLIGVGHSLGFAWLLRQPHRWRGLVSINGFTRFTSAEDFPHGVPPRVLARMAKKLPRDPQEVSRDFLVLCGIEDPRTDDLDPAALAMGLDWLASWDVRDQLAASRTPLRALAGADDPIVSAQMSRATFPEHSLRLVEGGGHLLPLSHPARCAEMMAGFMDELR